MGTIDSLFNSARDVANDVGKKVNDVVEVSKLKLSAVSLGSDIDKAYQKLGLMAYEMFKSGAQNHELLSGCTAEIDALKEKYAAINLKLDEIKKVQRCPSCGNMVDIEAQYCQMCGCALPHPPPPPQEEPIEAEFTEPTPEPAPENEEKKPEEPATPAGEASNPTQS